MQNYTNKYLTTELKMKDRLHELQNIKADVLHRISRLSESSKELQELVMEHLYECPELDLLLAVLNDSKTFIEKHLITRFNNTALNVFRNEILRKINESLRFKLDELKYQNAVLYNVIVRALNSAKSPDEYLKYNLVAVEEYPEMAQVSNKPLVKMVIAWEVNILCCKLGDNITLTKR